MKYASRYSNGFGFNSQKITVVVGLESLHYDWLGYFTTVCCKHSARYYRDLQHISVVFF